VSVRRAAVTVVEVVDEEAHEVAAVDEDAVDSVPIHERAEGSTLRLPHRTRK